MLAAGRCFSSFTPSAACGASWNPAWTGSRLKPRRRQGKKSIPIFAAEATTHEDDRPSEVI